MSSLNTNVAVCLLGIVAMLAFPLTSRSIDVSQTGVECLGGCAFGKDCCNGRCIDILGDDSNCGACGNRCQIAGNCCGGDCLGPGFSKQYCRNCDGNCRAGETCCYGQCVNLQTHPVSCGRCLPVGTSPCFGRCIDGRCSGDATPPPFPS
jgi:hypothetical protein